MPGRCRRLIWYYKEWLAYDHIPFLSQHLTRITTVEHANFIEVIRESPPPIQWDMPQNAISVWQPHEATKDAILAKINTVINQVFLEASTHLDILFRDFRNGTIIAVSDGSHFMDTHCAAAVWIIESECRTRWIMGSVTVLGVATDFNVYRSELTGLTVISIIIKILSCCFPCPQHLLNGCDGQAGVLLWKIEIMLRQTLLIMIFKVP